MDENGMRASETFYTTLWNQFRITPSTSFLFRFLRQERIERQKKEDETKAIGQRKDFDFSHATLDTLLGCLADRNLNLQLDLDEADKEWLLSLCERVGGAALRERLKDTRGCRTRYKLLQEALKGHSEKVTEQDLDKLRGWVLDAAVVQDAWTFFYDAGLCKKKKRQKAGKDEEPGEETAEDISPNRHTPRRKDRVLGMLDAWCKETHHSLRWDGASGFDEMDKDWRKACNDMFLLLQRMEEPTSFILPVRVDPRTGIGLYMVGIDYFRNVKTNILERLEAPKQNCVFLCFGPYAFFNFTDHVKTEASEDIDENIADNFYMNMLPVKTETEPLFGVTLEDGEALFNYILKNEDLAYECFRVNNIIAPPGTPKLLQIYFDSVQEEEKQPSQSQLVEEGRQESEKEMINL